jgi:putative phosphoserine phosphatase/1-acylglycerol-3-phosphate O-acyltransferase
MAMAAGVPVVPIVIRNAGSVLPRGAFVIKPGTVDVAVLAPIPTDGWTVDDLDARIAEVRQRFVDTLASWPTARPGARGRVR